MSRLTIYQDNYADTTIISNVFIDEYMKEANDAQLKVYLYLLRMMSAHKATSVSDIADQFNHTEKDVLRALKFWEKQHLLTLEYDEAKNLTGIRLLEIAPSKNAEILPMESKSLPNPVVRFNNPRVAKEGALPAEGTSYAKPSYTLDELREFKENEETAQILFVASQYIGKPLTASEMKTILFFSDKLKFSPDLIDYLIQYCVDKGKKDFRYIEKVAVSWAEEGITTPKQAAASARKYDKAVYVIMNALGKTSAPTRTEADYALKWIKQYGFSTDIIAEACERTVLATDKHRFEYADKILTSWYDENVRHKADILMLDEAYSRKRSLTKPAAGSQRQFNQFMQNDYDFEALEKEILSN